MPGCQARTSLCAARPRLSSMSSGVARPAAAQEVCGGLGPTVAGEGALLVPVHAADPGRRREVGEVPHVLADDRVHAVEDTVVHVEVLDLVLLGPRHGSDGVEPLSLIHI